MIMRYNNKRITTKDIQSWTKGRIIYGYILWKQTCERLDR